MCKFFLLIKSALIRIQISLLPVDVASSIEHNWCQNKFGQGSNHSYWATDTLNSVLFFTPSLVYTLNYILERSLDGLKCWTKCWAMSGPGASSSGPKQSAASCWLQPGRGCGARSDSLANPPAVWKPGPHSKGMESHPVIKQILGSCFGSFWRFQFF